MRSTMPARSVRSPVDAERLERFVRELGRAFYQRLNDDGVDDRYAR